MKIKSSVKKRCVHCYIAKRRKKRGGGPVVFVCCRANPKHKQRQG